jgi:hypothetical protein
LLREVIRGKELYTLCVKVRAENQSDHLAVVVDGLYHFVSPSK